MPRTHQVLEKTPEIEALEKQLSEAKKQVIEDKRKQEAQQTLTEYESEYEHAKLVFFKVNGARRVLKNNH